MNLFPNLGEKHTQRFSPSCSRQRPACSCSPPSGSLRDEVCEATPLAPEQSSTARPSSTAPEASGFLETSCRVALPIARQCLLPQISPCRASNPASRSAAAHPKSDPSPPFWGMTCTLHPPWLLHDLPVRGAWEQHRMHAYLFPRCFPGVAGSSACNGAGPSG